MFLSGSFQETFREDGMADKIELPITGMNCAACSARIERELNKMDEVREAHVNFPLKKAVIIPKGDIELRKSSP